MNNNKVYKLEKNIQLNEMYRYIQSKKYRAVSLQTFYLNIPGNVASSMHIGDAPILKNTSKNPKKRLFKTTTCVHL